MAEKKHPAPATPATPEPPAAPPPLPNDGGSYSLENGEWVLTHKTEPAPPRQPRKD